MSLEATASLSCAHSPFGGLKSPPAISLSQAQVTADPVTTVQEAAAPGPHLRVPPQAVGLASPVWVLYLQQASFCDGKSSM